MRRSLFLSAVLCLGTVLSGCGGTGQVRFANRTGETIVEGHLKVGDRVFDLAEIRPGDSRSFSFHSPEGGSDGYQVGLTLANGRRAVGTIGTLRRGTDYEDLISVEDKRILLQSRQSQVGQSTGRSLLSQEKPLKWISLK